MRRDYQGDSFHEEDSEGLLPVLHLSSGWLSSPSAPTYKCQVHRQLGCLRHPEPLVRKRLAEPLWPIGSSGRQGEHPSGSPSVMVDRTTTGPAGGRLEHHWLWQG